MSYKIPLFDLNFDDAEINAVVQTIKSGWISTGPQCGEFERMFADMLGVEHALSVANCTTALHLAFDALDIKEGDEVICPSLSFVATVNAIRYVGAIPVFCDVSSCEDLNIAPFTIEKLISPKTAAIVVMHFAGFPCKMNEIMDIAKRYNLKVIEDACHGPLSEYEGKKLGTIGDVGCFSFFSNKNISTGEGGMIVTNNGELSEKLKLKRSHGMTTMSYQRASGHSTYYDVVTLGYNYRMDDMRAALGIEQLKKIRQDLNRRAEVRGWYLEELLKYSHLLYVPFREHKEFCSNYIFPVILREELERSREEVRDEMHKRGIQTSVHYPAIHRFSIYQRFVSTSDLSITEYITDREITLPMYAGLTKDKVSEVVDTLISAIS